MAAGTEFGSCSSLRIRRAESLCESSLLRGSGGNCFSKLDAERCGRSHSSYYPGPPATQVACAQAIWSAADMDSRASLALTVSLGKPFIAHESIPRSLAYDQHCLRRHQHPRCTANLQIRVLLPSISTAGRNLRIETLVGADCVLRLIRS